MEGNKVTLGYLLMSSSSSSSIFFQLPDPVIN